MEGLDVDDHAKSVAFEALKLAMENQKLGDEEFLPF
jgi:hypothetical protein